MLAIFLGLVSNLSNATHTSLVHHLASSSYPTFKFTGKVEMILAFISSRVFNWINSGNSEKYKNDWRIATAARVAAITFSANSTKSIQISTFYCTAIPLLSNDLIRDFEIWQSPLSSSLLPPPFTLCSYPFLLPLASKILLLKLDGARQMEASAREAIRTITELHQIALPFLSLEIRREFLIRDSLRVVSENRGELKKSLRVGFVGEEGIDGGGLRKEWFLLVVRELFNPVFGLFVFDE
jgi:E3 ubiquitin-protein ligase HECTD2